MGRLFGTDGVRGVANRDLTGTLALDLGRAAVSALTERGEGRPRIAVGRDTRGSGEFLEAALVAGICSAGGDAVLLGVCPTPAVAFRTVDLGAQAGLVSSATNINEGGGATVPDVLAMAVVEAGAVAGVAHDGDADRAMFADHQGNVVDGDQVLAACALALDESGELPGSVVVSTVMANLGFRVCMERAGIRMIETKVGDRYVLEEMHRSGAVLGGEQSGHVIFLRHATTGDGLLTA